MVRLLARTLFTTSLLGLLFHSAPAFARQSAQGWCQAGGRTVTTSGLTSSTLVQQSAPSCTVTVNVVGGGLATIFSDNAGTPLSNPFTAASNGQWQWYADNGHYTVVTTGGTPTLPTTVTYQDILLDDVAGTGFTYSSIAFSATPVFNSASASYFVMTLTGNVTSSTVSGSPVGGSLIGFQICQDATGNRTFAWPGNFTRPPTISPIASSCTQASFVFDSTSATWRDFAPPGDAFTSVLPTTCGANSFLTAMAEQGGTCLQPSVANLSEGFSGSGPVVRQTSATITTPGISGATLSGTSTFTGPMVGTTGTYSSNVSIVGTLTCKNLQSVRCAASFTGADWGAKVAAADADLGATPGEIWLDQSAGTSPAATAPVIASYHKLKTIQGGVYQISTGWTETSVHDFGIECSPGTVFSFTGSAGFTIDGSALGNGSRRNFISNCIFSGNASVADAVTLNKVVESTFINLTGMNATATAIHCKGCLENTFISPRSSANNNLGPVTYSTIPAVGMSLDTNGSIQSNVNSIVGPTFEALTGGIGISCVSGINNVIIAGTSEANATGLNVGASCVGLQVNGTDFESNTTADATLAGPGTVLSGISAFSSVSALVQLNSGATNTVINGGKIFAVTLASGATNSSITGVKFQNITINAGATGTSLNNVDYSVNGAGGTLTDSAATTTHYQVRNLFTGAYEADQFNNAKGVITNQIGSISGALTFATNSGAQTPWNITDTGGANSLNPDADAAHNIGSSGLRPATVFSTVFNGKIYNTATNCSSSASPAVCAAAPAGSVAIANPATTIQVNTTVVTANSQILVQEDSSLGTKLGVTCNATLGRTFQVTARSAGTSFTITASATPAANSACLSYSIVN